MKHFHLASLGIALGLGLAVAGCTDTQTHPKTGSITANRHMRTGSNVPQAPNASGLNDRVGDTNDVSGAGSMGNATGLSAGFNGASTR